MSAPIPDWFTEAVSVQAEEHDIEVEGCPIRVRSWGDPADRGIVLVHGGAAQSHWWDHIAPVLARAHRVVALDLSGHGDSGRRPTYPLETWGAEVIAVVKDSNFIAPPMVIGHSMGGWVSIMAGSLGTELAGVAVIDTPLTERTPEQKAAAESRAFGPLKTYPTREDALARFRPVPEQPNSLPFILDHIALHSVTEVDGGWRWKFDPGVFVGATPDVPAIPRLPFRGMMIAAENGLVGRHPDEQLYHLLGDDPDLVVLPRAGHHIMLDEPLSLTASLLTLLALWEPHSPRSTGPSSRPL